MSPSGVPRRLAERISTFRKYFRLTGPVIPRARAEAIMALVDGLDGARALDRLAALLRRPTGRGGTARRTR